MAFPNPRAAKYVPVRISAMETPAPNQINPLLNTDVFSHSLVYSPSIANA